MKREDDFSQGARGKFHRPRATPNLPEYLDADGLDYLAAKAKLKGTSVNDRVDDLLRKDIELIEEVR